MDKEKSVQKRLREAHVIEEDDMGDYFEDLRRKRNRRVPPRVPPQEIVVEDVGEAEKHKVKQHDSTLDHWLERGSAKSREKKPCVEHGIDMTKVVWRNHFLGFKKMRQERDEREAKEKKN